MIFKAEKIVIESEDAWYLSTQDEEIGYSRLASIYSLLSDQLESLVDLEFSRLADAQDKGLSLEDALIDPNVHVYETTHLASLVVSSRSFLTGYYGTDLIDDK